MYRLSTNIYINKVIKEMREEWDKWHPINKIKAQVKHF